MRESTSTSAVFQEYGYSILKTNFQDTFLATKRTENSDSSVCTIFGYRVVTATNDSLHGETTRLLQHISNLHQSLQENPHMLFPSLCHESISFLGKQVQVLCDTNGRVLSCVLQPLLILHGSEIPTSLFPTGEKFPVVLDTSLKTYLHNYLPQNPVSPKLWLKKLIRANHYLASILFIVPILLGVYGILHSVGFQTLAQIMGTSIILAPLLLLLLAWASFHDFQKQNQFKVSFTLRPTTRPMFSESFEEDLSISTTVQKHTEQSGWSSQVTTAFLQDTLESTLGVLLLTYTQENWKAYARNLQIFLINGIRLNVLQRTGTVPPEDIEALTHLLPADHLQDDLTRLINRLDSAQQTLPLTKTDAQNCANFAVNFLRSINAISTTFEERLFRIIPRTTSQSSLLTSQAPLSTANDPRKAAYKNSPTTPEARV